LSQSKLRQGNGVSHNGKSSAVSLHMLLLGDGTTVEMQELSASLHARSEFTVHHFSSVPSTFATTVSRDWSPDLIVVLQNHPDEYTKSDIARLITEFPLSRIVCCGGVWCESDGRNRSIWPPAVCVPARAAWPRIYAEIEVVNGDRPSLPLTAGRDEVFEFDHRPQQTNRVVACTIMVVSPDRSVAELLADSCRAAGFEATTKGNHADADLIIVDADPLCPATIERIHAESRRGVSKPLIAVMTMPTPTAIEQLKGIGVSVVVSKLAAPLNLPSAIDSCFDSNAN